MLTLMSVVETLMHQRCLSSVHRSGLGLGFGQGNSVSLPTKIVPLYDKDPLKVLVHVRAAITAEAEILVTGIRCIPGDRYPKLDARWCP